MGNNFLSETIPTEIGQLVSLDVLSTFFNMFTGTVPTELGQLAFLRTLVLENNALTGSLPTELGNLLSVGKFWMEYCKFFDKETDLTRPARFLLVSFNVADNRLTGIIPTEIGLLTGMSKSLQRIHSSSSKPMRRH